MSTKFFSKEAPILGISSRTTKDKKGGRQENIWGRSGGKEEGIFAKTLDTTDIFTGWTETICVENKSPEKVFKENQLPETNFSDAVKTMELVENIYKNTI
ncbi:MAG TPA: hypothetical protein P5150_04670 [Candidatus Ratteibacteria bacterium]|nr:hypothetical protein [bacterium]HRR96008.1 hypothetical protein [Candidatus Ratteibacteria bacterium]